MASIQTNIIPGKSVEGVFSISNHAFSSTFVIPLPSARFPFTVNRDEYVRDFIAYTFTTDIQNADDPSDSTGHARLYFNSVEQLTGKHTYQAEFNTTNKTFNILLDNGVRITGLYGPTVQVMSPFAPGHGIWDQAALFLPTREGLP